MIFVWWLLFIIRTVKVTSPFAAGIATHSTPQTVGGNPFHVDGRINSDVIEKERTNSAAIE